MKNKIKISYVYIMTNKRNTVLYIGVTSNLSRRVGQHQDGELKQSFTNKYKVNKLIYFEEYTSITSAIEREKQLKNWHREWKINLIKRNNPNWIDLSMDVYF